MSTSILNCFFPKVWTDCKKVANSNARDDDLKDFAEHLLGSDGVCGLRLIGISWGSFVRYAQC